MGSTTTPLSNRVESCRPHRRPLMTYYPQSINSGSQLYRVARGVRALHARLDVIRAEMASALRQRDQHYRLADAFLDEFDDLAQRHRELTRVVWKAEQRLAEAAMRETDAKNREAALTEAA